MNTEQRLLRKRIWLRPWFKVFLVLVLVVALFVFFRLRQKYELDKKLDEIRAAGYPATCEELDKWYSIPPNAENAADTILDAIAAFKKWPQQDMEDLPFIGTRHPPGRTETMTEPIKEIISEYLADKAKALELLHKASQIRHCRFPVDYTAGFNTKMNHLNGLRKSFRLLILEASFYVQNNRPDAAIDSIDTAMRLSRCLDKEPLTISQLVRIACQADILEALEYIINQIEFSDQQLNGLSHALEDAKNPDAMRYGFAGEIPNGMDFITKPTNQKLQLLGGPPSPLIYLYTAIGMNNQDAFIYLDIMVKYREAYKLPPIERLKVTKAVADEAGEISKIHFLARVMTPAIARLAVIDCRNLVRIDAASVALAVERYRRLADGKLPESLNDLVPKFLESVPIDLFDGKQLKYKKLDPGFVIYSVGEDEQDDGGKERQSGTTKPWDITFIIER
jgi:hypothetical protein